MELDWVEGFEIRTEITDGTIVISANREGLLSLAKHCIALAEEMPSGHIHLDEYNSLEEGSAELILVHAENPAEEKEREFRVISQLVRFGCGYRFIDGKKQYFAWHGYPNRNDDYFTTAEISAEEYRQIAREYPCEMNADRETAEVFRRKYVDGHRVLLEGWNKLL